MDRLEKEEERLSKLEEKLKEKEGELREKAREKGRILAQKAVRKVDPIFHPRRLNPDDSKVIFHPIDYIVFNGMKDGSSIKSIVLLDRETKEGNHRAIQKSIERVMEKES